MIYTDKMFWIITSILILFLLISQKAGGDSDDDDDGSDNEEEKKKEEEDKDDRQRNIQQPNLSAKISPISSSFPVSKSLVFISFSPKSSFSERTKSIR